MPDSIFDMQQTLFTSNSPAPTPRDRGQESSSSFDHVLDSAQRQNRDGQRAHDTALSKSPDDKKTDDPAPADDAKPADQDQVTLSQQDSPLTPTIEVVTDAETVAIEVNVPEETAELTAEEIAAAAVAPLDPAKPVLKQAPQPEPEQAEHHEGIELNDAVQIGGKRNPVKPLGQTPAATKDLPIQRQEVTTTAEEAAIVDPSAVVVATELHSTKVAAVNKNQIAANKTERAKSAPTDNVEQSSTETDNNISTGQHAAGAFAVTVTPEPEGEAPAPKRRLETSRQVMPEVHETDLKLAASYAINAAAAIATTAPSTPEIPAETTTKPVETPSISAAGPTASETPATPNHLRGPQVPHSFTNHLEAAAAERKTNDPLNGVDRTRFVQRVARAFQRAGETEGEIRLRLSPPELGAVKLEVSLRDGAMIARMETETTTARNLLMDNLPQLKERLAEQNIRIETFEVEVRDQSNHSSADDAKEQLRQQSEQQRNRLRGERATTPVVAQPIVRTLPAARQSSQLNVVI